MVNFQQEIIDIINNNYQYDMVINSTISTYPIVELANKQIAFHLIPLPKPDNVVKNENYFASLSDNYALKGYKLIHIWEDLWVTKQPQIQSRIMLLLGSFVRIHARKTIVKRIDKPTIDHFLSENHTNSSPSAKFKYGLFYEDKLVAAASFSGLRTYWRNSASEAYKSSELIRFANLNGHSVAGGLSKLITHFIREHKPDDIMSYADRDWSTGESYEKLGFIKVGHTPPQMFCINSNELKREYTQHILQKFDDYNPSCNTLIFLASKSYLPIFNAGNFKYLLILK